MRKSIHTYIDYDLSERIYELAKKDKIKINEEFEKLLKLGLSHDNLENKIDHLINAINKNTSNLLYIKKLEEQIYADLGFSQIDPDKSNNLIEFKNRYKKDKNKFND